MSNPFTAASPADKPTTVHPVEPVDPEIEGIAPEDGDQDPAAARPGEVVEHQIPHDTALVDLAHDDDDHDDDGRAYSDPAAWPPLFSIMPATSNSGATTLANWCVCAEEVPRDAAWRPTASPWLVITAERSFDGVRRARQLAGALTATQSMLAAIVLLEPAPTKGAGNSIQIKEMIAAAESAGVQILTLHHDPQLAGNTTPTGGIFPWSPKDHSNISVPAELDKLYTRLFFTIADRTKEKAL